MAASEIRPLTKTVAPKIASLAYDDRLFASLGSLGHTEIEMLRERLARMSSPVATYLAAAGLVAAAAIVHFIVEPWIHPTSPYALFYLAILGCAWFFGAGPALRAAVLTAIDVEAFLVAPQDSTPLRLLPFVFSLTLWQNRKNA